VFSVNFGRERPLFFKRGLRPTAGYLDNKCWILGAASEFLVTCGRQTTMLCRSGVGAGAGAGGWLLPQVSGTCFAANKLPM